MNKKTFKKSFIVIIITFLVVLNCIQYFKLHEYRNAEKDNDVHIKASIDLVCNGINMIESSNTDELSSISVLSAGTSQISTIYRNTSYYKENKELSNVLWTLNNIITNRSDIKEIISKNDLKSLIPVFEKLRLNPTDKKATEELKAIVKELG